MRPDDINPRTGLVVALVSVFLVFGFMFTVSGIKGETLGDIPLLALGPAICLPGIAAIALTRKTDGCTKWPDNHRRGTTCGGGGVCCCCCVLRKDKPSSDKEVLELLRTPSDLESGRGSCDELAKKAYEAAEEPQLVEEEEDGARREGGGEEEHKLEPKAHQEEMVRYLEHCYPAMPGNVFVAQEDTPYYYHSKSALEKKRESPAVEGLEAEEEEEEEDNILRVAPSDTIIVCSYKEENSPYDRYCCYINPSEEICSESDHEAVV